LAKIYTENKQFSEVVLLLKNNNDFFGTIPKARTAKIVRNMLNIVASVPDSLLIQIELCQDVIAWCKVEKRTFLRQRIEAKV
jgi:26S proteasome regulatory subunit N6